MLDHERLVELHRELAETRVLSVYIDGRQHDPAGRNKWRTQLEHGLDEERRKLARGGEGVEEFDAAARFIQKAIDPFDAFPPGKAFVAFATADKLWYAEPIAVTMPDLVRWDKGIAVAPYVRGLKQERPVVVALADSQRARIFLYRDGTAQEVDDLRADTFVGDLTDSGASKRSAVSSGLRGETSTDAGQRILEVAAQRMVKELVKDIAHHVGDEGFVVLGGTAEMSTWVRDELPKQMAGRVLIEPSLHVDMRDVAVRQAVGAAASELTKRWQLDEITAVFDQARASARGAMGNGEVERALKEMRVDTLFLARSRTRDDPADADRLLGLAFAGGAMVEEVAGAAGDKLDNESEGIAARLRFRAQSAEDGFSGEPKSTMTEQRGWKARGKTTEAAD